MRRELGWGIFGIINMLKGFAVESRRLIEVFGVNLFFKVLLFLSLDGGKGFLVLFIKVLGIFLDYG